MLCAKRATLSRKSNKIVFTAMTVLFERLLLRVCQILLVRAFEVLDLPALEMPDARGDFVDDVVVVGYQQDRAFIFLQGDVERVDGFQVQVIGRLVEHQEIRLLQHQAAEDQPRGLAAGKRVAWASGHLRR